MFLFAQSKIKELGVPNIEVYNEYIIFSSVTQGENGLFYFLEDEEEDGVLYEFDGQKKRVVFKDEKITFRKLLNYFENKVFIGAHNNFGYLDFDHSGNATYKSLSDMNGININIDSKLVNIILVNDTIYFIYSKEVFAYSVMSNSIEKILIPEKNEVQATGKALDKIWISLNNNDLFSINNSSLTKIKKLKNEAVLGIFEFNKLITFIYRNNISFFNTECSDSSTSFEINDILRNNKATSFCKINEKYIAVGIFEKGLYIIDNNLKIVRHFDINSGLPDNLILEIANDNQGGLWVSTASAMCRIDIFSPFTFINNFSGVDNGLMVWSEMINDSTILFSLTTGLYRITNNVIEKIEGGDGFFYSYIKNNNQVYLTNYYGVYILKENKLEKVMTTILANLIPANKNGFFISSDDGIFELNPTNDFYKARKISNQKTEILPLNYFVDTFYYVWQIEGNNVCRYNFNTESENFLKKDTIDSLKWVKIITKINNKIVLYDEMKAVIFNNKNLRFEPYKQFENLKIRKISAGKSNDLLFVFENDDIVYENNGKSISKPFKKFKSKTYSGVFEPLSKNNIIIGFPSEFVHYDSEMLDNSDLFYKTIIRNISITNNSKDSTIFKGNFIECKFNEPLQIEFQFNNITFEYSGVFFENQDSIVYSAKLEGMTKNWSEWASTSIKEYTNLPEGDYVFRVKSKNIYDTESNIDEFAFTILPPWYRTWWAYAIFVMLGILLFYATLKLNSQRLVAAKKRLEKIVKDRTAEIEQQKEEIETQRDMLVDANAELEKLSIVASETDNSVTIADEQGIIEWVNDGFTRLLGYTKDEFIDTFGASMISSGSSESFHEKFLECVERKTSVIYESKLKTKSGVEIWAQRTLTPIFDKAENLKKLIAIDSDISLIKKAQEEIAAKNKQITDSINYAQYIQRAILPSNQMVKNNLPNSFIFFKPKDVVSGDFYWFSQKNDTTYIALADATGHGVPGAFMSMIGTTLLNDIVNKSNTENPSEILHKLNKGVVDILSHGIENDDEISDGMDISLCKIDKTKNKITISLANHYAYIVRNSTLEVLEGDIFSIGGFWAKNPTVEFTNIELNYTEIDALYMFSDGFRDQPNEKKEKYKDSRFKLLVESLIPLEISEQQHKLEQELKVWKGKAEQIDDILVIGIKF
ncbi:MAG: hypothetical protein A2265_00620 [Bacteroidetes bacterium RIFOXYA12_FULL_33_9]|nr:MAG: hypothetical protein A2265_00620 [Bacteroidetes bacterium RIFOXYA12_FULL_33_9]